MKITLKVTLASFDGVVSVCLQAFQAKSWDKAALLNQLKDLGLVR